jgi:hypothetical protein
MIRRGNRLHWTWWPFEGPGFDRDWYGKVGYHINPHLDPDGSIARNFVSSIVAGLS